MHLPMKKNEICVVLPAYNEAKYLAGVLKSLNRSGFQYVVVDDGSSDDTYVIAKRHSKNALRHRINLGKGAALRTGCEFAFLQLRAKAVIFMDSDAQHSTDELDHFHLALSRGNQMVLGVRAFDSSMPLIRIVGNRFSSLLVLLMFGRYIPDIPSGFKAMTKRIYRQLKLCSSSYNIELEIAVKLARKNIAFSSVPITTIYHDLQRGFHPLDTFTLMLDLLKWRVQL